jgi:hypothetical protein
MRITDMKLYTIKPGDTGARCLKRELLAPFRG